MILYPAIDLKDGVCVRVVRGDFATATVFNKDPVAQALAWRRAGFDWLHLVDLDGSVAGRVVNQAAVAAILAATELPIQLGGGIRTLSGAARWIEGGVSRIILGTAAIRDPGFVREAARLWPGQVAVGIDVRAGKVAIDGWTQTTEQNGVDLARRFEDAGVCALIVTDIDRDGARLGFNVEVFGAFADAVDVPVIAAGGFAGAADIANLRARSGAAIGGAVLGRALYDGVISPAEALAASRC